MTMTILLKRIPGVIGIYGKTKEEFPASVSVLYPAAADSFAKLNAHFPVRLSDMWRSAAGSLRAMREKAGVQPPGYSAHNYGFAIDVAVDDNLKRSKLSKPAFDALMVEYGWYCHRRDGQRGFEEWHYNYFGEDVARYLSYSNKVITSGGAEQLILDHYGKEFSMTPAQIQQGLADLKFYRGKVDGDFGPLSKEALIAFQTAWGLKPDGVVGPSTQRTLAFVLAKLDIRG